MIDVTLSTLWIVLTAFLWGATDPLLKLFGKSSAKSASVREKAAQNAPTRMRDGFVSETWRELGALLANWKFVLAFLANQLGSVTFVFALVHADLSVAVPVTNGLKFLFNFATGRMLGEEPLNARSALGLAMILVGVLLQIK